MKICRHINLIWNRMALLQDKPLLLPSKRYVAVTLGLAQVLKVNQQWHRWGISSLPQAVRIEQWLMQGWEREKKRLCQTTLKVLAADVAAGRWACDPSCIEYFLDLQALAAEGYYNQVLNELYGQGKPLFDALIYVVPSESPSASGVSELS